MSVMCTNIINYLVCTQILLTVLCAHSTLIVSSYVHTALTISFVHIQHLICFVCTYSFNVTRNNVCNIQVKHNQLLSIYGIDVVYPTTCFGYTTSIQ